MTNVLAPFTRQQYFLSTSAFDSGGFVYTYAAGSSTPIATYTATGATNLNPVILDSRGSADIWLTPNVGYKFNVTDPNGNSLPGYPLDNIIQSQLITLYGGVDTGVANSYILNFTAPYSTLTNGIVIYWIPSNTNNGSSTLSVNGLGTQPLVNPNGMGLSGGAVVANSMATAVFYNGVWLLTTSAIPQNGSFLGTLTSGLNSSSAQCSYTVLGNVASLYLPYFTLASGGTLTLTSLPAAIQPYTVSEATPMALASNNGVPIDNCIAYIPPRSASMSFYVGGANFQVGGWTGNATIGALNGIVNYGQTITYGLY
jgi:hypothetical protein